MRPRQACDTGDQQMPRTKRYYSADDSEFGVTPSKLKRLSKARQREYLLAWFGDQYEDPANETPYDSSEGGYQFIWGGPYDAREELYEEFGHLVSEELIEDVVSEVESDGLTEWAPGRSHPDHERAREEHEAENQSDDEGVDELELVIGMLQGGAKPNYGSAEDTRRRTEILTEIEALQRLISPVPQAGIGHNNPPPDEDDGSAVVDANAEVRDASAIIRSELTKSNPDALQVAHATSRLRTIGAWFAKKADVMAESFAKAIGDTTGKAFVVVGSSYAVSPGFQTMITNVVQHVTQWLAHVTLPF